MYNDDDHDYNEWVNQYDPNQPNPELEIFTESLGSEFQLWISGVKNHLMEISCYGVNLDDVTKTICDDLFDVEIGRTKFITYNRDWQGDHIDIEIHPAYNMYKEKIMPKEAAEKLYKKYCDYNCDS